MSTQADAGTQTPPAGKKPKKRKRKIIRKIIILLLLAALLGTAGFIVVRKLQADYRVTYDPYTASVGTISKSLSYSGSMQLISNTTYSASSDGKVREVYVSAGQQVKEGDKLIRLSDGTTLTAEFDGTVNKVEVEKGDEVRSGANLVQVTDFDHMQVSFRIGESDIQNVTIGQQVRITVASISANFSAEIDSIDYSTYTGNSVAYYTAQIKVDTSGIDNIYPGMQATITIPQEEARDVVVLKMDAISASADNSAFVWKQAEDGSMYEQAVTVGLSNGNYVEIKSGVSDGETVYVQVEEEETSFGSILSGLFGSQKVNAPSGGSRNFSSPSGGSGGFSSPSGSDFPGGGSFSPGGGRNRGN